MKIDEILKTWKQFEKNAEKLTEYKSMFGSEFKLKMPSVDDKPKLKLSEPPKKAASSPADPTPPSDPAPDWKTDVRADMTPDPAPQDRLKDPLPELPIKVKDPSLRTKSQIRDDWEVSKYVSRGGAKGKIFGKYKDLGASGFRFKDFYKVLQAPKMKSIRRILGSKDHKFGPRHAKAMRAYVAKVGSFNASRELGVDELKLKKMFGSTKIKKGAPPPADLKNWTRVQGGALRVPDKFIQKATRLATKSGVITPEQAKAFLRTGMVYDPRTGKTSSTWGESIFGAEAVRKLAGLYASRGYDRSKHIKRTGHSYSPFDRTELTGKIKYLRSKIKGGKVSATSQGAGGDYKGKWKRDFATARRLMKSYGSLAAWQKYERTSATDQKTSLSPRVRKMFSRMSLDQTLGNRALRLAKNPKYTLQQLIDMRKNRSGPEGLRVSAKLRRKQALLDRAIALRRGAAQGYRRVKLPGGLIDFDAKGILTK
tara:strand:+ start:352 stop:1794 length:1443 start_codon:yes stop_codon:yes gene_type:complete